MDSLHHLLVKLETLRTLKGFDPQDRALMSQYMVEVSNEEALVLMQKNPVFIGLMQAFKEEIVALNNWILTNAKELSGSVPSPVKDKANYLIAKKETLQAFIDHYSAEPVDLISHIEERADHFLKKHKINL